MKISLAVPSLDQGRFLRACLDSILAQEHQDFEVLIADGGSRDESLQIIAEFCARDPRFTLVSREDVGQADAIAKALDRASGEVCGFLNVDDLYLHDQVFTLVAREFANPAIDVLSGGGSYIDEEGRTRKRVRLRYHPLDGMHLMRLRTAVLQPATFWRRRLMTEVALPTDMHYAFDAWFFYDLWQRGVNWRQVPSEFAGYRLHGQNKSLQISARRTLELASLEDHKFGPHSWRGSYLRAIARVIQAAEQPRFGGASLRRGIYTFANSLSFLSAYRIPGI